MIEQLYYRRFYYACFFTLVVIVIVGIFALFMYPVSGSDWVELLAFIIPIGFGVGIAINSYNKYQRVKALDLGFSTESIFNAKEVVFKQDVGLFTHLLLFTKSGDFPWRMQLKKAPFFVYPLAIPLKEGVFIFPLTYELVDSEAETVMTFKRTGVLNSKVTFWNADGELIGSYEQKDVSNIVRITGTLKDENDQELLSIRTEAMQLDFHLKSSDGRQWARFYNGYFPNEYTNIFRDFQNDVVSFSDELSDREKKLMVGVVSYIFLTTKNGQ